MSGQRGDLDRKRQRDKQNKSINRDQTKKLLDALDSMVPSSKRKLVELNGNLRSSRTTLHLLEDLVAHLRAMPTSARAGKRRGDSGVSLEEATARVMSSQRECFMSVELPSWRIKGASAGLEKHYERSPLGMLGGQCFLHLVENESVDVLRAAGQAVMRGEAVAPFLVELRTFSREGLVCLNVIRCRVIPVHVSYLGEAVLELEAQERAEVRESWPAELVRDLCMIFKRDPATSNAYAYDIDQSIRSLSAECKGPMHHGLSLLASDSGSRSIMSWIRQSMGYGATILIAYAKITESHVMFDLNSNNQLVVQYHVRMRLGQMLGGYKSNWRRVFRNVFDLQPTMLSTTDHDVYVIPENKPGREVLRVRLFYIFKASGRCFCTREYDFSRHGLYQSCQVFRDGSDVDYKNLFINFPKSADADRELVALLEEDNEREALEGRE